eukprot:64665-Chlamydomonas_euryale.AAC.4
MPAQVYSPKANQQPCRQGGGGPAAVAVEMTGWHGTGGGGAAAGPGVGAPAAGCAAGEHASEVEPLMLGRRLHGHAQKALHPKAWSQLTCACRGKSCTWCGLGGAGWTGVWRKRESAGGD